MLNIKISDNKPSCACIEELLIAGFYDHEIFVVGVPSIYHIIYDETKNTVRQFPRKKYEISSYKKPQNILPNLAKCFIYLESQSHF